MCVADAIAAIDVQRISELHAALVARNMPTWRLSCDHPDCDQAIEHADARVCTAIAEQHNWQVVSWVDPRVDRCAAHRIHTLGMSPPLRRLK